MNEWKNKRLLWDEFFMFHALLASFRSSCLHLHNGAVIIMNKRIIASGYNGAPPGIQNCLKRGCRKEEQKIEFQEKDRGVCRGTHAEMNALSQISRWNLEHNPAIYTIYEPCNSCLKAILGSGIGRIIYLIEYSEKKEAKNLKEELIMESGMFRYNPKGTNIVYEPGEIPEGNGFFRMKLDKSRLIELLQNYQTQ
ncbi:MAG: deaminase [Candidatus Pacearchaeota archaeon]|nr:deaminase [Candidatus Pacearchaeota archaeon]